MLSQILSIVFPVFLIVVLGFGYSRVVKPDLAGVNRMIIDLMLPILIFTSLASKDFDPAAAVLFSVAATLQILGVGILALAFVRISTVSWRAFLPCVMFGNVGPVGIPVIVLAFGQQALPAAVVLLVLSNILHFTLGAALISGRIDWRTVYANPLVWATLFGITFAQWGLHLPVWLDAPLLMISNVVVPLMLLSLGARLSGSQIRDANVGMKGAVLTTGLRLIACYLILFLIPLTGYERGAFILFACLPSAVFNFMLADKFQTEPNKVASIVIMGHLASIVVLPFGIWLALL